MSFLRCKKEHKIQGKGRERQRKATAKLMVLVMLFTLCMVWAPGELNSSAAATTTITYNSYVQSYGWTGWKNNGALSGKTGESKRLEGINIKLKNKTTAGSIKYRTYVQTYGWKPWVTEGNYSGTKGESKRIEAIQIKLTGKMANAYDVYYRVHAQSYGWLAWAKNGASAGTQGLGRRIEAIQIVLVKKGGAKPGNIGGVKSARKDSLVTKAMIDKEWRGAYISFINQMDSRGLMIKLADLDNDGTPELFVSDQGYGEPIFDSDNNVVDYMQEFYNDAYKGIYTYSGGKVKKIGDLGRNANFLIKKDGNYYLVEMVDFITNGALCRKVALLSKSGNTVNRYFELYYGGRNKHIATIYNVAGLVIASGEEAAKAYLANFGIELTVDRRTVSNEYLSVDADGAWKDRQMDTWVYSVKTSFEDMMINDDGSVKSDGTFVLGLSNMQDYINNYK